MSKERYTDTEIALKCVDENEVIYDEKERHLIRIKTVEVTLPVENIKEALKNVEKCQSALHAYIKQRIILNSPTVRFNKARDVAGLEAQIQDLSFTAGTKQALRDISETGYQCLQECNLLDNLVELDAERNGRVVVFGREVELTVQFDMLVLLPDNVRVAYLSNEDVRKEKRLKAKKEISESKHTEAVSNNQMMNNGEKKVAKATNKLDPKQGKNTETKENSYQQPKCIMHTHENNGAFGDDDTSTSEATYSVASFGKAAVTVVFTARGQVPATVVYRQLMYMYTHRLSTFHILVFHLGPLVENQHVTLYEYRVPKVLSKWIKTLRRQEKPKNDQAKEASKNVNPQSTNFEPYQFNVCLTVKQTKTLAHERTMAEVLDSSCLDVNKLESKFREIYGRNLQQTPPLRDYFRYLVNDCPGVKDHFEDKKARFDRYVAKRGKRYEMRTKKRDEKENEKTTAESTTEFTFKSITADGNFGDSTYRSCRSIDQLIGDQKHPIIPSYRSKVNHRLTHTFTDEDISTGRAEENIATGHTDNNYTTGCTYDDNTTGCTDNDNDIATGRTDENIASITNRSTATCLPEYQKDCNGVTRIISRNDLNSTPLIDKDVDRENILERTGWHSVSYEKSMDGKTAKSANNTDDMSSARNDDSWLIRYEFP